MPGENPRGNRLKKLRQSKGLTLRRLADQAGVTAGYLSKLEKGWKENPSRQVVEAIARALGVPPAYLASEQEAIAPPIGVVPMEARYLTALMLILARMRDAGDADALGALFELLRRTSYWNDRADRNRVLSEDADVFPAVRQELVRCGLV